MWSAAEIDEVALAVERDRFVGRDTRDDLRLVFFADATEELHGFVAIPDFARNRLITIDDFLHAGFDDLQVVFGKRFFAREVVVEAVVDRRSDCYLRVRPQLLDRFCESMRCVVTQQFHAIIGIARYDFDRGIVLDVACEVPQFSVDTHGDGVAREALTYAGGDFGAPGGSIELLCGAIG